jgi:hypothetical protein
MVYDSPGKGLVMQREDASPSMHPSKVSCIVV